MVVKTCRDNILESKTKQIAFAVTKEGINQFGFANFIAEEYWPELSRIGEHKLGTVISHESDGIIFHGLVCYSIENGFPDNQEEIIRKCFDNIPSNGNVVSAVPIGTQFAEIHAGARYKEIFTGIHKSKQKTQIYTGMSVNQIMNFDSYDNKKKYKKVS